MTTRDWTPIGAVTLNPDREIVTPAHRQQSGQTAGGLRSGNNYLAAGASVEAMAGRYREVYAAALGR